MEILRFLVLLIIIQSSALESVFTQNSSLSIGAFGGLNNSSMRGTKYIDDNHTSKIGFTGGISLNFKINDFISFQPEMIFERKGSSSQDYEILIRDFNNSLVPGGIFGGDFHYDYLTIPLLLKISTLSNPRLFVNIGSYFSYLVNQTNHYGLISHSNSSDFTYPAKPFDFGIVTGIGIEIPLNKNVIFSFEGRNNLGLFDIGDIPAYYDFGSIKHNSFAIIVALKHVF